METFVTIFTSREIASILWLCFAFIVLILHPRYGALLFNLIKAISHRHLVILYGLLLCNLVCIICFFKWISYWKIAFFYDAVIWFLFTALELVFRLKDINHNMFLPLIKSEFTALLFVEFLIGLYSYSIVLELLAIPIFMGISLMMEFARNQRIAIYTKTLMGVYMLIHIAYNVYITICDNELIHFMESCYQFILPLAYTIFSIPFFFMIYVYLQYEKIYVLLTHFCGCLTKNDTRRILLSCLRYCRVDSIRINKLKRIIHKWSIVDDADICIADIKQLIDDDRIEEQVQSTMALSLFNDVDVCCEKFSNIGLGQLRAWCDSAGDAWYSSFSNYVFMREDDVCLSLYLYGSKNRVKKMELHMHIRNERSRESGLKIYEDLINRIFVVLGIESCDRLILTDNYDYITNQYTVSIQHEKVLLGETWQWNISSHYCKS